MMKWLERLKNITTQPSVKNDVDKVGKIGSKMLSAVGTKYGGTYVTTGPGINYGGTIVTPPGTVWDMAGYYLAYSYVAYDNAYEITISPDDASAEGMGNQRGFQDAERKLNLFKKGLKEIGYLDNINPIVKIQFMEPYPPYMAILPNTEITTPDSSVASFWLHNGEIDTNLNDVELEPDFEYYNDPALDDDANNLLQNLQAFLRNTTNELTKQGYQINNKNIATLLAQKVRAR